MLIPETPYSRAVTATLHTFIAQLVEEIEERFPDDSFTQILDAVNEVVPPVDSSAMEE
jgi:hypothetical protein